MFLLAFASGADIVYPAAVLIGVSLIGLLTMFDRRGSIRHPDRIRERNDRYRDRD